MPTPRPFQEALAALARKSLLPTSLGSAELMGIGAQIRERSLFSAKTTMAEYLSDIYDQVTEIVAGRLDQATARLTLKQSLDSLGYTPDSDKAGTIEDLGSKRRLDLVIRTNTEMAQGYGTMVQGNDPAILDQWPCQELFRAVEKKEPREWLARWRAAGGKVYPGQAPGYPIGAGFSEGRLIARKDDPVWEKISTFGLPYPPFDFGSGMEVRDISRREAEELGVIERGDQVARRELDFNASLQSKPGPMAAPVKSALLASLGDRYEFDGDTLRRKDTAS